MVGDTDSCATNLCLLKTCAVRWTTAVVHTHSSIPTHQRGDRRIPVFDSGQTGPSVHLITSLF